MPFKVPSLVSKGSLAICRLTQYLLLSACVHATVWAEALTVCVEPAEHCDFSGPGATQRAVDAASDGDVITLSDGRHLADDFRDVAFGELLIRGGTVIRNKSLTLRGSGSTSLETTAAAPASALVVNNGTLNLHNLVLRAAPPKSAEDDIYDGHGLFLVDAQARVTDVVFADIVKMAVSVRGDSRIDAQRVKLMAGHVGVWVEEAAQAKLTDCVIYNNDSAAVAAYMQAQVYLSRCVLEQNLDDGLYAAANAQINADRVLFLRNAPFAARAVDAAQITISNSVFYDNAQDLNEAGQVRLERSRHYSTAVPSTQNHKEGGS